MRTAVYAGSFDPLTLGHRNLIENAARIFDFLFVAVGVNPNKKTMFSVNERKKMIIDSVSDIDNVVVRSFENMFLVDYCKKVGAQYYVRGLRNEDDYRFEKSLVAINREIAPEIQAIWLPASVDNEHVSSSVVKSLIGPDGWEKIVQKYIPEPVFEALKFKSLQHTS